MNPGYPLGIDQVAKGIGLLVLGQLGGCYANDFTDDLCQASSEEYIRCMESVPKWNTMNYGPVAGPRKAVWVNPIPDCARELAAFEECSGQSFTLFQTVLGVTLLSSLVFSIVYVSFGFNQYIYSLENRAMGHQNGRGLVHLV